MKKEMRNYERRFKFFHFLCLSHFVGVILWVPAYVMIGDQVAPGGQLFSLVTLTVAANFGGWLISLTTLPRLIGMLFTGILMQVGTLSPKQLLLTWLLKKGYENILNRCLNFSEHWCRKYRWDPRSDCTFT